ncbi:hypothetical protein DFH11DRAFT_1691648 [Phellopilus nigrolimitatus]|nr:hypothetical protein DFH11DRAFT_1691648 [Phellopilus nigrolimitatus]
MQNRQLDENKHSSSGKDILRSLEDYSDVAAWINDIIDDDDGEEDRDGEERRRVSHLSAVLELEKTIDEVSRTVPRLTYDLQLMQEKHHSQSFLNTAETGPVLDQLHFLDMVKRNMEASLVSEVLSFLTEQALSEASKSLGFESRKTLMINLQNQLEAALSSALVAGINSNDVEACKKYFDIFCHIEREADKRKGIVSFWQEAELRDCEEITSAKTNGRKFAEVLSVLQVERVSAVSIFPDPQSTLSTFITSMLSSLHPSPSQRLNALGNFYGDLVLPELISSFKATEEFAKVGYSSLSPSAPRPSLDDREIRQSFSRRLHRSSISVPRADFLGTGATPLDHSWEEALFEPFLEYQCDYATLEKRLLRAQLRSLLKPASSSPAGARVLAGSPTPDANAFASGEEFAELDYSAADLASFQLVLHLLEAARSVLDRLTVFEAKLRAGLLQTANALKMARNDPFGIYVSGTTRTALKLQKQQPHPHSAFTPNSAALSGLSGQRMPPGQSRSTLLFGAKKAVSDFAKACQVRLQETILAPLLKHLSTYPSSSVWASENPRDRRAGGAGAGAISEVVIPTFSLSPSANIQRVAEGLLSLPRLFEVYADDDALAFSIETLPFVDEESLKAMAAEGASSVEPTEPDSRDAPRSRAKRLHSPSLSIKVLPPTHNPSTPPTLLLTPEAVSSAWLASLALTLLAHLTDSVLPAIPRLSSRGAAQLAEDLGYLSQIVKALNVEWETLEAVARGSGAGRRRAAETATRGERGGAGGEKRDVGRAEGRCEVESMDCIGSRDVLYIDSIVFFNSFRPESNRVYEVRLKKQ